MRSNELVGIREDGREINYSVFPEYVGGFKARDYNAKIRFDISNITLKSISEKEDGGAIQFFNMGWDYPDVYVVNCSFENITSLKNGGSLFFKEANIINVKDVTIKDSTAANGGAFHFELANDTVLSNISIINTKCSNNGGGVNAINSKNISLIDMNISNIKSSSGCLYLSSVKVFNAKNLNIHNSTSSSSGNSITTSSVEKVFINDTKVTMNNGGSYSVFISGSQNVVLNNVDIQGQYGLGIQSTSSSISVNNLSIDSCNSNSLMISQVNTASFNNLRLFNTSGSYSLSTITQLDISDSSFVGLTNTGYFSYSQVTKTTISRSLFNRTYSSLSYNGNNFTVESCLFAECSTSASMGGAIFIASFDYVALLRVSFFKCSSSSYDGGAIYMKNNKVIVLKSICASSCFSLGIGFWGYFHTNTLVTQNLVSITQSGQIGTGSSTLYFTGASSIDMIYCNVSHNKGLSHSGLNINGQTSSSITYCNMNYNQNSNSLCFFISYNDYAFIISKNNFLFNKAGGYCFEIQNNNQRVSIMSCIFILNEQTLLYGGSLIKISSSYIYHQYQILGGSAALENCITSNTYHQTHHIAHYATYYCPQNEPISGLDIPCQTLQAAITYQFFPSPTECQFSADNSTSALLSKVFHLLLLSIISFNFAQ